MNHQNDSKLILITGVAGFIGRYIARYFFQKGWKVWGIDNSSPENAPLSMLTEYHQLRLPNQDFNRLLKQKSPTLCVHCAGRASVGLSLEYPSEDFYANTVLTFELLNTIRINAPQCKFIFLSSAAVYGNPTTLPVSETQVTMPISPYGFHKLQSEQLCSEFNHIYGS
jgi:UDP-glucose 4-epimerase